MRLFPYFIFAYVALGLQMGLAPYIRFHGAAPNLVLLAVIFIGLNAPRDPALLGCFGLGLLQDLATGQQPGLFAFSYGLTALLMATAQQVVYREHPLTHLSLAFVAALITAMAVLIQGWVHPPAPAITDGSVTLPAIRVSPVIEFVRVLYTAALAPVALPAMRRARRFFAFQSQRRRPRT